MTTGLLIDSNGIVLADQFGRQIFNAGAAGVRMFHCTDVRTGSKSITAKNAGINTNSTTSTTHTLETGISADATHIIGAFKVSFPGSTNPIGVAAGNWHNAGGTYIHWFDGGTQIASTGTAADGMMNNNTIMSTLAVFSQYTFRVASSTMLLDEHVHIMGYTAGNVAGASGYTMRAFDINYYLLAGLLT